MKNLGNVLPSEKVQGHTRNLPPQGSPEDPSRTQFRNSGWGTVLTERQNVETIFKEEISRLREKWSRAHNRETHAPPSSKIDGVAKSPDGLSCRGAPSNVAESESVEEPTEPRCLFLVMRRLPYTIKYSRSLQSSRRNDSSSWKDGFGDSKEDLDLTKDEECRSVEHEDTTRILVRDEIVVWEDVPKSLVEAGEDEITAVEKGRWKLTCLTSGVNYLELFKKIVSPSCTVLMVGDPVVDLGSLSNDKDAQSRLQIRLTEFLRKQNIIPVWLGENSRRERYSEDLLYPLFHYRTPPIGTGFSYLDWPGFTEANKAFADTLKLFCEANDWFLIFNYHLMILPQLLRDIASCEKSLIYFYLPTVFPSSEMYRILPERQELLTGVLHSDIVGFHSHMYRGHFMTAVTRVLGVECTAHTIEPCVESGGVGTKVTVSPLGVNCEPWVELVQELDLHELRQRFRGKKIILGVDNLDYTKGISQKMVAFRKFLTTYPKWADRVVFVQLCLVGRRTTIDTTHLVSHRLSAVDRKEILTQVFQVAGHINSAFGTIDHLPVHFLVGQFSMKELAPVYAIADIGVMTSLRESISPSLYHFILCQAHSNKGVCIVSEFSSTAQLLAGAALQVNPWDINHFAATIRDALTMPEDERKAAHDWAYSVITKWDAAAWARQILADFREAETDLGEDRVDVPPPLDIRKAVSDLCQAKHVIVVSGLRETLLKAPGFMLDQEASEPEYELEDCRELSDEELVKSTCESPNESNPTSPELPPPSLSPLPLNLLKDSTPTSGVAKLSALTDVSVIIASSASVPVLERILADAKGVWALAENGHFVSYPGSTQFESFPVLTQSTTVAHNGSLPVPADLPETVLATHDEEDEEIDLQQCLAKVGDLVQYFVKRTPGSFKRKTETSVSWHYGAADTRFAAQQGKDLLFYLYAGPLLNNKNLELCVGKSSVEVRSCKVTKCVAVEWIVKQICQKKDLRPSDLSILCIGNFLPRDEDLYTLTQKLTASQLLNRKNRGSTEISSPFTKVNLQDTRKGSGPIGPTETNEELMCSQRSGPPITQISEDMGTMESGEPGSKNSPLRCITCTVGIRFSKSAFRLETKTQITSLLGDIAETMALKCGNLSDYTSRSSVYMSTIPSLVPLPAPTPKTAVNSSLAPSVDIALSLASPHALGSLSFYQFFPSYGNSVPHIRSTDPFDRLDVRRPTGDHANRSLTTRRSKSAKPRSPEIALDLSHSGFLQASLPESPATILQQNGSDVDEDMDADEEEIFLPSALTIPNSIPFTHARKGVWTGLWREAQESTHKQPSNLSLPLISPYSVPILPKPETTSSVFVTPSSTP